MFIIRWFKRLLMLIGLGTVIYWGVQYVKTNSPVRQKLETFKESPIVQEGVKDAKTWASEVFKSVGSKLGDEVTPDEKKELDDIFSKELGLDDNKKVKNDKPEADQNSN